MGMDDTIFNYSRDWVDWRIAEYSSDDNRFGRIYYRGFNDDIGCRGGGIDARNRPTAIHRDRLC